MQRSTESDGFSRREFFSRLGDGLHGAALATLLSGDLAASGVRTYDLKARPPHFQPRATSVIHLFMNGGPSQVDLFDRKPALERLAGSAAPRDIINQIEFANEVGGLLPSPYEFKRHGESGMELSSLLPHLGEVADDITLVRSMYGEHQRWTDRGFFDGRDRLQELQSVGRDITSEKLAQEEKKRAFAEIKRLKSELEQERDYLREEVDVGQRFGEIIGQSPALNRVLEGVAAVAGTDASVLLTGESGVGKELIARAIHSQSRRCQRALIKVNCPSIPHDLFESEFFGHVKGAFTGAQADRVGRFQLADGATIFLDEVAEIPLELQVKLLRVLQEGEFERIGESVTRKVDVRVIAATNRDLKATIRTGRFREDLYYRLSVFPLEVPPLRQRRADIIPLATHFLRQACQEFSRTEIELNRTVVEVSRSPHRRQAGLAIDLADPQKRSHGRRTGESQRGRDPARGKPLVAAVERLPALRIGSLVRTTLQTRLPRGSLPVSFCGRLSGLLSVRIGSQAVSERAEGTTKPKLP